MTYLSKNYTNIKREYKPGELWLSQSGEVITVLRKLNFGYLIEENGIEISVLLSWNNYFHFKKRITKILNPEYFL